MTVVRHDGCLVVTGEIDASTAPELADALDPLPDGAHIRLDVSGVEFMDSSGLRVLIEAHQRAELNGQRLVVERPSASVTRVMEITGLLEHLNVTTG